MSLKLTNRLDQIENDIRLMLMLQKCGNITRSNRSIPSTESNPNSLNLSEKASRNQRQQTEAPPKTITSLFDQRNSFKSPQELIIPTMEFAKRQARQCGTCGSSLPDFSDKTLTYAETILAEIKPYCKKCYFSPGLELEYEQARRQRLEDEVNQLKTQLSSTVEGKSIAITMTKQLKKKYEKMKSSLEETNNKLVDMLKEKDFLCKCLEREKASNVSNTKGVTLNQVDSVTSPARNGRGLETIQEHDEQMKSLQESILMLSKQLQEKEKEKQNLITQKEKIVQKLKKQKDATKTLSEANQKLMNTVKSKHDNFALLRQRANRCQKEKEQYKSNWNKSQLELEKLRQELQNERTKADTSDGKQLLENVSEKLRKSKEKERRASETIQTLIQKIKDMEEKPNKGAQKEISGLTAEVEKLRAKIDHLTYELRKYQEEDASVNRNQPSASASTLLQARIDELIKYVEEEKRKNEELGSYRQQQDVVIKSQNEQLVSKEEQIRLQEQENEIMREKCLQLDKQLETLCTALDSKKASPQSADHQKINELEHTIEELRSTLESEKQKVNEQEKLIKERTNELEVMRKCTVTLEQAKDKLQVTIRELAREKEATKMVADGLEKLNLKKEKLEDMMVDLEGSCKEVLVEKDQYVKLCTELEKELDAEKKLRIQERQTLVEERNKAFEVARLAAMTLIETVDDYEILTKSQLEAKHSIANLIKNKQQRRRPGCPPAPLLKSKEDQTPDAGNLQNEETTDTTPNSSVINVKFAEPLDDFPGRGCTSEMKYQPGSCCFGNGIADSDVTMGLQIPVNAINPYNVQSALIPSPYACWLRNCGYQPNQPVCPMGNPCQIPGSSSACKCQCGLVCNAPHPKSAKIHAPVRVKSKKSSCACPRRKHTR